MAIIKAVFWDNDGLLVDTEEICFSATREVLSEVGVELTMDEFIQISLTHGQSAFDFAAGRGVTHEAIVRLQQERNRRYADLLRKGISVLDGVKETKGISPVPIECSKTSGRWERKF